MCIGAEVIASEPVCSPSPEIAGEEQQNGEDLEAADDHQAGE
jgi:hypothetical protein